MGIKFLCPNGHKLNVKAFLSGKKAICPKCGIKVIVPHESAGEDAVAQVAPDDDKAVGPASPAAAPTATPTVSPTPRPAAAPAASAAPRPAAAATGARDALDEDPNATWYVRPPSGGQFGPAAPDMMRTWIAEGRVTATSLVWRAGWPDWRSAGATFPQLNSSGVGPAAAPVAPIAAAPAGAPVVGAPAWSGGGASPAPVMGAPVGAPVGMAPMGAPVVGGVVGAPMGMPMGAPVGMPMGAPVGAPMGQVVGGPMGMPVGQVVSGVPGAIMDFASESTDDMRRRRKRKKSASTAMVATVALVVMMILLAIVLVFVLKKQADDKRLMEENEVEAWSPPRLPGTLLAERCYFW